MRSPSKKKSPLKIEKIEKASKNKKSPVKIESKKKTPLKIEPKYKKSPITNIKNIKNIKNITNKNKNTKSPVKKGKDGTVTVIESGKKRVVRKMFRKNKNREEIDNEVKMMKKGHNLGISPKVYTYFKGNDSENPYIDMEELGETLFDIIKKEGNISDKYQQQIISILETLDENHIFHGDISPLNFMTGTEKNGKKDRLYIIDYGMAKKMDSAFIKKNSKDANVKLGITVFILKIREQCPEFKPELLLKKVYSTLSL